VSTADNKATVLRMFEEADRRNFDAFDEILAADYRRNGEAVGREGAKAYSAAVRHVIPDMETTVADVLVDGDRVAIRYTWRGTHLGETQGIPPTGRQVASAGLSIYRFVDEKIVDEWDIDDRLGAWQQLGYTLAPEAST
jgi:predicted ester cyclase